MHVTRYFPLFQTSDGVALAGKDYVSQKGSLVFEDGETEKEIKIAIITDCAQSPVDAIPFTAFNDQIACTQRRMLCPFEF